MDTEAADFQRSGYLSSEQAELLRSKVDELLAVIRPQAVPLVDSFKLPDYLLNSALGRDDGEVYRALFDFAIRERASPSITSSACNAEVHCSPQFHSFQCRFPLKRTWYW